MSADRQRLEMTKSAEEILDLYFLDARCALLETAALMDRLERRDSEGNFISSNPRIQQLVSACRIITDSTDQNRVQSILELLSE